MRMRLSLALVALSAGALSAPKTFGSTSAGNMPGSFGVSRYGSAQYSIPIWTPPGIHGVQPRLSLFYDSHAGSGIMGPGWNLSGLSTIYRCNPTYAQDAAPAPVTLTLADAFCIDGSRLRLTSSETLSEYGSPGSTYQTEIANFANVTASTTVAGAGPAYFTVQGKDGLTYEYGNTASSQVLVPGNSTPYEWALDKVTDRAGNYMTYTYLQTSGSAVISSIEYTAAAGSATFLYQIKFGYLGLPAAGTATTYVSGTAIQQPQELSSITIVLAGTTTDLRVYNLNYVTSPTTGRSTLQTVQECGGSTGNDCLPETTVFYQSGGLGVASPTTAVPGTSTASNVHAVDINGDGRKDLVYSTPSGSNLHWWVAFATASGYEAPADTGLLTGPTDPVLFDDFLGEGKVSILAPQSSIWTMIRWSGTAFAATSTGLAIDTNRQPSTNTDYATADIDGDGLPDLVAALVPSTGSFMGVYVRLNTGKGASVGFQSTPTLAYSGGNSGSVRIGGNNQFPSSSVSHLDVNGDGRGDLLWSGNVNKSCTIKNGAPVCTQEAEFIALISDGLKMHAGYTVAAALDPASFLPLNFNDDACTDFVDPGTGNIYIAGCNGASAETIAAPANIVAALDWDGDGRTDLITNNGGTLYFSRSLGGSVASGSSTSVSAPSTALVITDQNGDGLDDWAYPNAAANQEIYVGLHAGANQPPDLANSFTDGYGNYVKPTYSSIVIGGYTAQSNQSFPYQNWLAPYYTIQTATVSDPTNAPSGTYALSYTYAGAAMNLQGRGFVGMATIASSDSRNNVSDTKTYNLVFPYTGMLMSEVGQFKNPTTQSSQTLSTTTPTPVASTIDSTNYNERYFLYASPIVTNSYEVNDGSKNGDLITSTTRTTTYDNYGNALSVETVTTDEDGNSPKSPTYLDTWTSKVATTISADTSTWCLNVPTETVVTNSSTAPGGAAIARTVNYTPDYTNCRVSGKVTAPGTAYQVSEVYGFDSFGNVKSDAVTGTGMATRTTGITWGTTGQFPTVITNALGQSVTMAYDPNTGNPSSQTDPNWTTTNPLATSWLYDDFGRKTKETRPDGTATSWNYQSCTTNGCVNANNQLTITQAQVNADGSTLRVENIYTDGLDRTLVTSGQMLNGAYDRNEVQYDNLGRVYRRGAPCTFVSCATYWTTNTYDVLNRITASERPISATTSNVQSTAYQYEGRTSTVKDPLGNMTTLVSLPGGALESTTDPKGYSIISTYDAFGSLISTTDSAGNTLSTAQYSYGLTAFKTSSTDMDMSALRPWAYTVDPLGEVTGYTDGKGQSFSMTYDLLSRPSVRTDNVAAPDLTTTWKWGAQASSYNIGKLASVTAVSSAGTWSDTYTYDSLTRYSSETITNPGDRSYTYVKTYNPNTGLPASLQYPVDVSFMLTLQYAYSHGILQSVSSNSYSPAVTFWTANATNSRGQVTQETYGNGVVKNMTYDAVTGWLGALQAGVGGGASLRNDAYAYDVDGNLSERQDYVQKLTENYYPDALNRLDHTTLNGSPNLQMEYDPTGNISSRSDVAGGATWTYDPVRKHAVTQAGSSANSYSYDGNGNAETRNGNLITWTSYNYPTGISAGNESVTFAYDANRQRWQEVYTGGPNGTETTYHAGKLFEVSYYAGAAHYRHYVYAGNELVSIDDDTTAAAPQYYVIQDHQGSIASLITSSTSETEGCPSGYTLSGSTCTETVSQAATINYSCPSGYTLSGSSCLDSTSVAATVNYSCPAGYGLSGTTCSKLVTVAASVSYSCPSGYSLSGTTCSETESEPATYVFKCSGPSPCIGGTYTYTCPSGWSLSGKTCYKTVTQAATSSYSCPAGYALSGATCSETVTQAATTSYSCPAGYTLSGSTCSETSTVAATASYSCPAGYSLSGTTCSETATVAATVGYSCPAGYSLSGTTCSETLTVAATDSAPGVFVGESYTPFGNRRSAETWSGPPTTADETNINSVSRRGFTEQTVLGISMGLNHMNGRIEDAITGRFLSPDPYTFGPSNTQSWNRYTYVYNNPLTYDDPSGYSATCGGGAGQYPTIRNPTQGCTASNSGANLALGQLQTEEAQDDTIIPGDASLLGDVLFGALNGVLNGTGTICIQNCGYLPGVSITVCADGNCLTTYGNSKPDPDAVYAPFFSLSLTMPSGGGSGGAPAQSQTSTKCMKLAQSLGFGPNYTAPSSSPIDDTWSIATGVSLAGNAAMALRGYVGVAGSRAIGGRSVGLTMGEISTQLNVLGGLGVGVSAYQAYDAYSSGNTPSGVLSTVDGLMGLAAFIPGPDVMALAYGLTRIVGDVAQAASSTSQTSVLQRMGTLQSAGCL